MRGITHIPATLSLRAYTAYLLTALHFCKCTSNQPHKPTTQQQWRSKDKFNKRDEEQVKKRGKNRKEGQLKRTTLTSVLLSLSISLSH